MSLLAQLAERTMRRHVPLSVHLDLTMRCNEACVHCYRVVEDRAELTREEIVGVLDDLASAGTLYLTFSGGEVFLRPDLFEIVAAAKCRRFDVRLKSNALRIGAPEADRLRALGVRQVDVSLYSADPTVHDAITRVPGSQRRTLEGVVALRDAGVVTRLNCPVMASNGPGFADLLALADHLGVQCGIDPMITSRTDGNPQPLALRLGRTELLPILAHPRLRVSPPPPSAGEARGDLDEVPCGAANNAAYINPYGDVMPCVALPMPCGNVRERRFSEIWTEAAGMRRVRSIRIRDLHTCRTCTASAFCSRCPGQALLEDGDLYGPARAHCEHARIAGEAAGVAVTPASLAPATVGRRARHDDD